MMYVRSDQDVSEVSMMRNLQKNMIKSKLKQSLQLFSIDHRNMYIIIGNWISMQIQTKMIPHSPLSC